MRRQALERARTEGRAGASRLSDEVLFATGPDPSDTFIGLALDHLEAGQRERFVQDGVPEASGDAAPPVGAPAHRTTCPSGPEVQANDSGAGPRFNSDRDAA
jgi:hypothetical protein